MFGLSVAETLLGKVIAYAVELQVPAQLIKQFCVILMRFHVGVIYTECQIRQFTSIFFRMSKCLHLDGIR